MYGAVRIYQAVHAEVSVMRVFFMVSPIEINFFPVIRFSMADGMVAPFPHEPPTDLAMLVEYLEIILQVAGAVPHGMAIFTQDQGLVRALPQILANFLKRRVHPAVKVQVGIVVFFLVAPI